MDRLLLEVYIIASLVGAKFILYSSGEDEIGLAPQVLVSQKQQRLIGLDSVQYQLCVTLLGEPRHQKTVLEVPPLQSIETLPVEMDGNNIQK